MLGWGGCIAFRLELPCTSLFRFRMLSMPLMFLQLNYWESSNSIAHRIAEKHVFEQKRLRFTYLTNDGQYVRKFLSTVAEINSRGGEEIILFHGSLQQPQLMTPSSSNPSLYAASLHLSRHCYNQSCAAIFQTRLCMCVLYTIYMTLNDNIKALVRRFLNPCRN